MGVGKFVVVCCLTAGILAWIATWMSVFTVKNEIVVAREASEVYRLISDLRNHNKYHQYVPKETQLLHSETSPDGVEQRTFRTRELVPLPFGFHLPVTFDALTKLTKPNRELVIDLDVGFTKGTSTWTLEPHKGTAGGRPRTLITEEFTLHCQWITCSFVEEKARSSHEELFRNLKSDLDGTDSV